MSQARESVVRAAFDKMACGRSSIEMGDISKGFDASKHPAVQMGLGSEQDVYGEMMQSWDINMDGVVTWEEFKDYFCCVSASVATDEQFCGQMKAIWGC